MKYLMILIAVSLWACSSPAPENQEEPVNEPLEEQVEAEAADEPAEEEFEVIEAETVELDADHVHTDKCNSGTHNCGDHCGCGEGCKCVVGAACSEKCEPKAT
jgi:hypothetical protein